MVGIKMVHKAGIVQRPSDELLVEIKRMQGEQR